MKNAIIIRYCEIHLKGKNRGFFEKLLKDNIKRSLKGINFTFKEMHSRYLIEDFDEFDYDIITEKLHKIAGIHTYSKALVVESSFDNIHFGEQLVQLLLHLLGADSHLLQRAAATGAAFR